jgi:hypothetical protein
MLAPSWQVRANQRLEQLAVIWNPKMEQLVRYDEVLKPGVLLNEIGREGNRARA